DFTHYSGAFTGPSTQNFPKCSVTQMHVGTVSMDLKTANDGTVTGTGDVNETRTITQSDCGAFPVGGSQSDGCCAPSPDVHGTTANLGFTGGHSGGAGTFWTYSFTGVLSGGAITGTFTLVVTDPSNPTITANFPVTLR